MRRSSTSSSESRGIPWAGLLAAVLVVAIDALGFDSLGFWQWSLARIPPGDTMEHGVAVDRTVHGELRAGPIDEPLVLLLGNSRVNRGLLNGILRKGERMQTGRVLKLAHGGVRPYELAAMFDECRAYGPDVVVTVITEFETHRPIQFMTHMGTAHPRAWLDLLQLVGLPALLRERHGLLGLGLATLLDGYRYRRQLGSAGLDEWRRFPRLRGTGPAYSDTPVAIDGEPALALDLDDALVRVQAALPEAPGSTLRQQIAQCNSVTRGPHALIQQGLLERAIGRLVRDGCDVLVVEAPIHPLARALFRPEIRADYQAWIQRLAADPAVHWLGEADCAPLPEDRWSDLTHMNKAGSKRLSELARERIEQILAARAATP